MNAAFCPDDPLQTKAVKLSNVATSVRVELSLSPILVSSMTTEFLVYVSPTVELPRTNVPMVTTVPFVNDISHVNPVSVVSVTQVSTKVSPTQGVLLSTPPTLPVKTTALLKFNNSY